MFNKTRLQLTVRNALVLFIILISLSFALYGYMKVQLFARVDQTMENMTNRFGNIVQTQSIPAQPLEQSTGPVPTFGQATPVFPFARAVSVRLSNLDRPVYQLLWLSKDRLLSAPLTNEFVNDLSDTEIQRFSPSRFDESPHNVKVGKQYFRIITMKDQPIKYRFGVVGNMNEPIETIQYITNITTETDMLRSLFYVLLIGGGLGLIITILAGFYLANRALIPIQLSWEKQQLFVSDASHELRTPLSVIQAHTELLLRHPDQTIEQESRYISTILKETKRMNKLVNGLLTLARVDSNQTQLDLKPICIDQILKDVMNQMNYLAEIKEIVIQTELDDGVLVHADDERIHQLFIILLDNALKYTHEQGFIQVSLKKYTQTVIIEVVDNGIGISQQDLPFIFDRFYRGDKARTRADGGTGLGLSIAKWIVEGHGGKIHAESKSAGTRFVISMPLVT
ncbi:MAG: HAMP domain-containing sensor histidine kinase [Paenibacillaceae bacterium]